MARKIALLQLNPTVGDLAGNVRRLETLLVLAADAGAVAAVATELAISGYPPRDLLLQDDFIAACIEAAETISTPIPLLVGSPVPRKPRQLPGNGALRIDYDGAVREVTRKQLLPTYEVFDEARYFSPDSRPGIVRGLGGLDLGVTICEDAWQHAGLVPSDYQTDPIEQLAAWTGQGVELVATVNLSSSPFHATKQSSRLTVARAAAQTLGHPFLLANQVGGNDDLLFDGHSLAALPSGEVVSAPGWVEGVLLVDLDDFSASVWITEESSSADAADFIAAGDEQVIESGVEGESAKAVDSLNEILSAVTIGLRDYCHKSGLSKVVLGMSGGIDSAVAACLATRALGQDSVIGISMPSRYSSQHSKDDAEATAMALGIEYLELSIEEMHEVAEKRLNSEVSEGPPMVGENIQARLRGLLVMGIANSRSAMAIATGNKSELAQGYCTLYGDMAGGYAPLGDLWKSEVYALATALNEEALSRGEPAPITESTLTKPPSAELSPNQRDDDTLPPYDILDAILRGYIEQGLSEPELVAAGHDAVTVREVLERLARTEHKRWQMPPAPRVSQRAFGQGWRQPLAANHNWRQ
ncbi:MAG: NAD+ synthase [Methanobacteriota archaeon]|nr:MAG: NAD+ synthase [Euryarchaeota archaeon]